MMVRFIWKRGFTNLKNLTLRQATALEKIQFLMGLISTLIMLLLLQQIKMDQNQKLIKLYQIVNLTCSL